MKAAAFTSYGPPDVLKLMDFEAPQADAGQVRVRVKAAGVQPADVSVRTGWIPPGAKVSFPQIPGNEFAGIIDQIGKALAALPSATRFSAIEC